MKHLWARRRIVTSLAFLAGASGRPLPPLAGQFVSLIKDSSLLSIIAISEFTLNAQEVNSYTFSTLESYLPLAAGYLILTLPISMGTRRLEQQHRYPPPPPNQKQKKET